jgi:alkylation response protein AidB-like acyl-CoA dehydrogenase
MRIVETEENLELRRVVSRLFAAECPPSLVRELKLAEPVRVPERLWSALADNGLLGLPFPERLGGQGAGLYELGLLFLEAGRVLCPGILRSTMLFGLALERFVDADTATPLLTRLTAGELTATVALWNPSDAMDVRPTVVARRDGAGWRLTGRLPFVADAVSSELMLVAANVEGTDSIGVVLVATGVPGWSSVAVSTIAGDRRSMVALDDVAVDSGWIVEAASDRLADFARLAVALQCMEMVGGASAVLDRTVAHVRERVQFGRPIGSFQAVQHLVADLRIEFDGATLAAYQALWLHAEGEPAVRQTAIAKLQCSRTFKNATLTAHQLHGGMGYVRETDLHLWSEQAKLLEVLGGTADVANVWLQGAIGLAS